MSKVKQGILGGFTGSIGNIVGSNWKGIHTMRTKPLSVANPRTAAQVGNRLRFKAISLLSNSMLSTIVRPLNDRFASKMSGYNLFCRRNKNAANQQGTINAKEVILSSGKLGETPILTATVGTPTTNAVITFSTTPNGAYQSSTDKMYCAILGSDGEVLGTSSAIASRSQGTLTVTCKRTITGIGAIALLSSIRADGSIVGDSSMREM